MNMSWHISVRE